MFFGLDSLYLLMEYPHLDVFKMWALVLADIEMGSLRRGIVVGDYVIRIGALGYNFSIWDGDARIFLTDNVEDALAGTKREGQGMGMLLQLGPKWLRAYGDVKNPHALIENIFVQFALFGVPEPEKYPIRLNRLDIALDTVGLPVTDFSIEDWRQGWVGYAKRKNFHDSPEFGQLEGLSIGSSEGAVRFKVYDKLWEALKGGTFDFWSSVWNMPADSAMQSVARFEWSIRAYYGNFTGMRYLSDFTFDGFVELLNYVSQSWGRLCIPSEDENRSRWQNAPLWDDILALIVEWSEGHTGIAQRSYDYLPDLKIPYLKGLSGWISGFMARLGVELGLNRPVTIIEALDYLKAQGFTFSEAALDKFAVYRRLVGVEHHE